LDEA
jgi:hypothetical protein